MTWIARRRPARKDTGPDPRTRALVWDREQGCCAACGRVIGPGSWWSIQHRKARGTGGNSDVRNLVLLCGSATSPGCHRLCEDRDPLMHQRGFWLWSTQDPAQVPVHLYTGSGRRQRWLTADGKYSPSPPGGAA